MVDLVDLAHDLASSGVLFALELPGDQFSNLELVFDSRFDLRFIWYVLRIKRHTMQSFSDFIISLETQFRDSETSIFVSTVVLPFSVMLNWAAMLLTVSFKWIETFCID